MCVRLPLFPLPVVLLPGMRMPLHIFEPRYKQMLQDCLDGDRSFGLIYRADDAAEPALPSGAVGCRALIDDVERLPDGRSNVMVNGGERFALVRVETAGTPYTVADVIPFLDESEPPAQVTALALRLHELFAEAARASRTLADDPGPPPPLPDDPAQVAFAAAASIDIEARDRQRLLASSSPSARLREMITLLDASMPALLERALLHSRAKHNGHGPRTAA